jgi:PTS system N-acetylgalactosamine-specific IIC component
MAEPMTALKDNLSWLLGGLGAAGGMMRNVGFAVLLKIMLSNDLWGIFFAGFAAAAILGNISATAGACLILVAFIGVAIAINDFNVSLRIKENAGGNGGMSDGI